MFNDVQNKHEEFEGSAVDVKIGIYVNTSNAKKRIPKALIMNVARNQQQAEANMFRLQLSSRRK